MNQPFEWTFILWIESLFAIWDAMGLLPDTWYCGLRIRRECWEGFPCHRLQRKPLVSDPIMHHGSCVTHVPWCMSGSLTRSGIPGACAIRNFTYLLRGPWLSYDVTVMLCLNAFSFCSKSGSNIAVVAAVVVVVLVVILIVVIVILVVLQRSVCLSCCIRYIGKKSESIKFCVRTAYAWSHSLIMQCSRLSSMDVWAINFTKQLTVIVCQCWSFLRVYEWCQL